MLGGGVGAQVGMETLGQLSSVTDNSNVIININTNKQTVNYQDNCRINHNMSDQVVFIGDENSRLL